MRLIHPHFDTGPDALFDRESIVPVALGMLTSIVFCVVIVPTSAKSLLSGKYVASAVTDTMATGLKDSHDEPDKDPPPVPPDPDTVPLGDDDPKIAQVAWISYDAYEDLVAPTATTVQPALQQMADPIENAPHRVDASAPPAREALPTPPVVQTMPEASQPPVKPEPLAPLLEVPMPQEAEPEASTPAGPGRQQQPLPDLPMKEDGKLAKAALVANPVEAPDPEKRKGENKPKPVGEKPVPPPILPAKAAMPMLSNRKQDARPTASPYSDREAPPVDIKPDVEQVRAGRVVTAQGVKVKTVVPNISVQTVLTAMRGGVRLPVAVTFDRKGRVTKAELKGRSGYPEIDSPIRASLYRWSASGKKLATMTGPFTVTINIIISNRI